jgi:hypothetical protein
MRARLVNESLDFQRGGNPLGSMGLGGFSFDTLRPGAILKSKKHLGVTERTGNITSYHSAKLRIAPAQYLLVTDVRPGRSPGEKNISFKRYDNDPDLVRNERSVLKDEGKSYLQWHGVPSGFFSSISKKKFDNRFEIIEPGFPVNEGLGFTRGADPHRALGIGNPLLRLKPGDILLPKKNVYVSETRHNFTSDRGLKIWKESYILVHRAFFLANGELKVGYTQLWGLDEKKLSTILPDYEIFWMRGTIKQYQNRFTVYEG